MSGWHTLLDAAHVPNTALEDARRNPEHQQFMLLQRVLDANRDAEFGRQHGFAGLRTVDAYRAAVPIRNYSAFKPFVDRIASGEAGVLTTAPVIAFEETGGSESGSKLIPYTEASLTSFRAAVLPWLTDLAQRRPGIVAGSTYVSISPATRQARQTAGGTEIGLGSDAAYLGEDLVEAFVSLLAVPPNVGAIPNIDDWRVATLAHLVMHDDLSFVSVWSPTFFLELIEALPALGDKVAASINAEGRRRLAAALSAPSIDTGLLWPQLDTISCWADGSSSVFARKLAALCPHTTIEPKGLIATEAAITVPWGGEAGAIPALTSTFIEFEAENGELRLSHELCSGARYRLIITTFGGLYRYDMGDSVCCVGHTGNVPRLVFEGRASLISDMVGEKLDEAFVAGVLSRLSVPAVLVPKIRPKPYYELWLDSPYTETIVPKVEAGLRCNSQYAYARDIGQLGPLVQILKPGFCSKAAQQANSGQRLGDVKHISLLPQQ
ncbi:MAG TPA: GH3 auxin-responsive promoter family protein [Bradyrhizobium sp.]|nr:GH3 auxin-responsive promoter family protein [Bradyrhizobium sp.]